MGIYQLTDRIIDPARYPWGWKRALWTPEFATTALWLDAADSDTIWLVSGAVSQWVDKSGNANHAGQATSGSRPTVGSTQLGGKDVVSLDGTQFLTCSHATTLNLAESSTIFSVYYRSAGFRVFQKKVGAGAEQDSYFHTDSSIFSIGGAFEGDSSFVSPSVWNADCGIWDGSKISFYRHGSKQSAISATNGTVSDGNILPSATPTNNTDALNIGRRDSPSGTSGIMTGHIAEIIIAQSALSTDDRQKVEGYLAHKWVLTANLPSDHPYKTYAPRV